jgi:CTP:molybdopterin cytidylyltransferase MocA
MLTQKEIPFYEWLDIIIPVAGSRLSSYGGVGSIWLGKETVLQRQIRLLDGVFPGARFWIVVGKGVELPPLPPSVTVRVVRNNDPNSNVSHSIRLAAEQTQPPNTCLIIYGDLVFSRSFLDRLDIRRSIAVCSRGSEESDHIGITNLEGPIEIFSYGLPHRWLQICVLQPREKKLFVKAASESYRKRFLGHEILNEVIEAGGSLDAWTPSISLVDIDSPRDIPRAVRLTNRED